MSTYKVTVNFPENLQATERRRAGIIVDRANGYEGELSAEQLEAIEADTYLTVEEVKQKAADKPSNTKTTSKTK